MIITYLELVDFDVNTQGELVPVYEPITYCPMPIPDDEPFSIEDIPF